MLPSNRSSILIFLLFFLTTATYAKGPPDGDVGPRQDSSYRLKTSVLSSAGCPGTSVNHHGNGSLGQSTPIGIGQAPDAVLYAGFWKVFALLAWPVGVEDATPEATALFQNYPNPFNPSTQIHFSLSGQERVIIEIFNIAGKRLCTLVDEVLAPGRHVAVWDGRDEAGERVASGIYFYRLEVGSFTGTRKMVMIK